MVTLKAYAKINLGLRILRKREDGYHDIETIFHRVNIYDEITLQQSSTVSLTCNQADLPIDEHNLCIRAAQLLQQLCNIKQGVHISLKKNIPLAAGLGGGSSDAATTLLGLVDFWNVKISEHELHAIAVQLGSDVPYFLGNESAYATGRGEILEYFHLDLPYWIVVVYPHVNISTSWTYQNIKIQSRKTGISLKDILLENINNPKKLITLLKNDFEPLVLQTHEPVARVKQSLSDFGADFTQLSGSGSSVYGIFSEESHARNAVIELSKHYQVFLTPSSFHAETR